MKKPASVALAALILSTSITALKATVAEARTSCKGYVGLTFDDGPTGATGQLLSILGKYRDTATFFDVGANTQQYTASAQRESVVGQVASHSYDHPFLDELTYQQIYDELLGTNQISQQITGKIPDLFRPPFDRLDQDVTNAQYALGLLTVLWNIDSQDYNGITPAQIKANVWNAQNGDVILFHDGLATTLSALPSILAHYQSEGLCGGEIIPSSTPHFAWSTQDFGNVVFYARVASPGTPAPTVASLGLTPDQQSTAVVVPGSSQQPSSRTSATNGRKPE